MALGNGDDWPPLGPRTCVVIRACWGRGRWAGWGRRWRRPRRTRNPSTELETQCSGADWAITLKLHDMLLYYHHHCWENGKMSPGDPATGSCVGKVADGRPVVRNLGNRPWSPAAGWEGARQTSSTQSGWPKGSTGWFKLGRMQRAV